MKWNKLLEKQIRKFLPVPFVEALEHGKFLQAINDSYNAYERDLLLAERAFRISEEEYIAINKQLTDELELKMVSISRLKEALAEIDTENIGGTSEDLLNIVGLFRNEIARRKRMEEELEATANRLSVLISNLHSGILLEDEHRRITLVNDYFCRLFGIDAPPSALKGADCTGAAEQSKHLFKQPELFVEGIKKILNDRVLVVDDELELTDGRFFERDYVPIFIDDIYRGHLWKYREITDRKSAERKLKESQELLQFALEGAGDGVWEYNIVTGKAFFSGQHAKMLGFGQNEVSDARQTWRNRVHPDDLPLITDTERKYLAGEITSHHHEYRILHGNGHYIWLLDRGMVVAYAPSGLPERIVGTHTDITVRKNAEQAIRIKEEKYRNIIANMNLGLLEVSLEDKIVFANQSFCEMSGYALEELEGMNPEALLTSGDNKEVVSGKKELRKNGVSDAYEVAVKNKRGEPKWWLISGAPSYDSSGTLNGTIGIHLDITEQKKLEFELKEARESAEQSGKAKEAFLANMSHEIRTPMNAILGMSRQLAKTNLDEMQSFYLKTINTATDHLMVVINDILDISKIEAGKMKIDDLAFKPMELLKNVVSIMQPKAEEKGLQMTLLIQSDLPPVLSGDPYRLKQVLLNLLSNSVKFTENGAVELRCTYREIPGGKYAVTLSVRDTGIGVDANYIPHIFDKFSQEYRSANGSAGGTGLGMSICKQLVELMDGQITISSEQGRGTEVIFTIPFKTADEGELSDAGKVQLDRQLLKGARILLAEDNEMNRIVVRTTLKDYGVLLSEVADGREAVNMIAAQTFDLVLMDVQMPVMNGLEATELIRKSLNVFIPVIALTANAIKGESDRCIAAGMNDFVSKPFEEEDIVNTIAHWLSVSQTGNNNVSQTGNKGRGDTPVSNKTSLYDLSKLEKIGNKDKGFLHKMIALFLEQVPRSVEELAKSFHQRDFSAVRSIAHRIKPTLDSMDILLVREQVRSLEQATAFNEELEADVNKLKDVIEQVCSDLRNRLADFT